MGTFSVMHSFLLLLFQNGIIKEEWFFDRRIVMELKWHKVLLFCPDCKQEPLITDISSSADGEVLVEMVCVKCGTALQMRTSGTRLATQALYADIEERVAKQLPQQKLIAPPPPPQVDPKADDDWLHDLGISGGE